LALLRARVADVLMTIVRNFERFRLECRFEAAANRRHAVLGHGCTCSTGFTTTSAKTPSRAYGSFAAHASASRRDSNSAMIRLPTKPAGPGSGASIAGWGPAKTQRPESINGFRY